MTSKEYLNGKLVINYKGVANMSKGFTTISYNIDYSFGLITNTTSYTRPCEDDDSDKSVMEKALKEAVKWCREYIPKISNLD